MSGVMTWQIAILVVKSWFKKLACVFGEASLLRASVESLMAKLLYSELNQIMITAFGRWVLDFFCWRIWRSGCEKIYVVNPGLDRLFKLSSCVLVLLRKGR